ncbi:MAG: DegT/DnrJ/EryC1/StrS family aminotransferase [Desulfovibrio sp.]|nr:DegT/DnrJ/EryC1/StrS family aminotransferase [Desulfovibrio sp.]
MDDRVEFIDLQAQFRRIEAGVRARTDAVLAHGRFIMGPEIEELEGELARFCGAKHCISCASGTEALIMALTAWGIGPGDAVFVPAFTFFATGEAPALLGATPVIVDIEPAGFSMDPGALAKAVAAVETGDASLYPLPKAARERRLRPRVVIPVDLFGQAADYDDLFPIAAQHSLHMLEDAAQSFGAEYHGRKTCALGCDVAVTSFFPAKPLGCYGDGGALFTEDDATADVLRSIRVHGKGSDKYDNVRIGLNGRMDTLQAAVLLAKLPVFPEELNARQHVAAWYAEQFADIEGVLLPVAQDGQRHVRAQYVIRTSEGKRDALAEYLKTKGIPTNIYYPKPMHMLEAFRGLGYAPEAMPVALAVSRTVLALPFHPYMSESDVARVTGAVREALR